MAGADVRLAASSYMALISVNSEAGTIDLT